MIDQYILITVLSVKSKQVKMSLKIGRQHNKVYILYIIIALA